VDRETVSVYNPADGSVVGSVPAGTEADVDAAVMNSLDSFQTWSCTDPLDRSKILFSAAQLVRHDQKDLAVLLTANKENRFANP
jgi:acyl-CoA reductase-like NAD-dependent aldehyde dehydrogenase